MPDACSTALAALEACKRELGLLPKQCYPRSGYNGQCDKAEFELKRCRAYDANPRDAAVLYNTKADRKARVEANARLQKKLQRIDLAASCCADDNVGVLRRVDGV